MAITYAQLLQAVQDYLHETESSFVTNVPTFVQQAERRILNAVQLPVFRKNSTSAMTGSDRFLATPTDFLSPHSLAIVNAGNYDYLLQKDVNFIREAYPALATTAAPKFYAIFDHDTFLIGPTPDSAYPVQLHYFYQPESIVTAGTSWLGDNADDALLYGTLVEGYTYLKGEADLLELYDTRYKEALGRLKVLADGKTRQDSYRTPQLRIPVS